MHGMLKAAPTNGDAGLNRATTVASGLAADAAGRSPSLMSIAPGSSAGGDASGVAT